MTNNSALLESILQKHIISKERRYSVAVRYNEMRGHIIAS